jgi:hypothetical protein
VTTTEELIAEARARGEQATPRPWHLRYLGDRSEMVDSLCSGTYDKEMRPGDPREIALLHSVVGNHRQQANVSYILAAVNNYADLADRLEAAREEIEMAHTVLDIKEAPRNITSPFDGEVSTRNLSGRISALAALTVEAAEARASTAEERLTSAESYFASYGRHRFWCASQKNDGNPDGGRCDCGRDVAGARMQEWTDDSASAALAPAPEAPA